MGCLAKPWSLQEGDCCLLIHLVTSPPSISTSISACRHGRASAQHARPINERRSLGILCMALQPPRPPCNPKGMSRCARLLRSPATAVSACCLQRYRALIIIRIIVIVIIIIIMITISINNDSNKNNKNFGVHSTSPKLEILNLGPCQARSHR